MGYLLDTNNSSVSALVMLLMSPFNYSISLCQSAHSILWVTDFPMFEWNNDEQRYEVSLLVCTKRL
jgi:aspartyl-tRNA synthetase